MTSVSSTQGRAEFRPPDAEAYAASAFDLADQLSVVLRKAGSAAHGIGPYLYDGATGVALFLAAARNLMHDGRAEGHSDRSAVWRAFAIKVLAPSRQKLRAVLREPERASALNLPIGGMMGIGSIVYSFLLLARWLDAPVLLEEAQALSTLISRQRIAGDDRLDVMSGSAGTILALLALDEELRERHGSRETFIHSADELAPLDRAIACGEHLLSTRASVEGRAPAWPGPDGRAPLTGYSHGAAGIAHALLRLFRRTGREEFRHAAFDGIAFERQLYDVEAANWIDPRTGRVLEQSAWCHGAPGVALGRLCSFQETNDSDLRRELNSALETTLAVPFTARDHLCCGNLGRADILLQAGRILGDSSLPYPEEARALAERTLSQASERGRYALDEVAVGDGFQVEDPTFFRGNSGVGYALLRQASSGRLPCILSMESPSIGKCDYGTGSVQ